MVKKIILFIVILVLCGVGLLLLPLIIITAQDIFGSFVNKPFSLCEVMDKARLEAAIAQGFDINSGCCAEHMIGECSIARPNSNPLLAAIENENLSAVQLLLDRGADINKPSSYGYALAAAASQGRMDMTQLLLEHAPSPESQDVALRMAAHFGHTEIAKVILSKVPKELAGPLCEKLACSLVTELEQLANLNKPKQRDLFLHVAQTCLDPNIFCEPFRLLSSVARKEENAPLFKVLLEHGGDLNAKEKNGKSVREFLRSFWDYDSRPQIKALIELQP